MKNLLWLACLILMSAATRGQGFEVGPVQETYKGIIGETIKAPIRFRNTTDKSITLIIRKVSEQIGATQKNFFCLENNCFDYKTEDYILRVEPGQSISSFYIGLDAGLVPGVLSVVKYLVYNKSMPQAAFEFEVSFTVEEKPLKESIYHSRDITLHDFYPNPAVDAAYVEYRLLNDQAKAKIQLHNILGNSVGVYPLSPAETLLRIKTDELNPGIYFYTLYVNNESVMTRKIVVKK